MRGGHIMSMEEKFIQINLKGDFKEVFKSGFIEKRVTRLVIN